MSKSNIKKITVDPTKCNTDSRRPSVFERLGTKPVATSNSQNTSDYCRNWALNGNCSYGKNCKYANTHTLISPSKRVKKDNASASAVLLSEDPFKRLTSKIVKKASHSPDLNLEEWNQTDLEYEDEKVLERRRQLLQRELELQMKKDKEVHGKDKTKFKKKVMSTSSSSRSSSSSCSSSSSSSDDSSSSSTSDSRKKIKKFKKVKHRSASPHYEDDKDRKKKLKLKRLGTTKAEKPLAKKKRKLEINTKRETNTKSVKKTSSTPVKKQHSSVTRAKSPAPIVSHATTRKSKERNRSESPKAKIKEPEKNRHHKKIREIEAAQSRDAAKSKSVEKIKDVEKSKNRPLDEKSSSNKLEDRSKQRSKDRERRSRTPPVERTKHQHSKDSSSVKSKRSRTPEKSCRSKHDTIPSRHQDKQSSSSGRSKEPEKKDRDAHKPDRSKDREDTRKSEQNKSKVSIQEDGHRKNNSRDLDGKNYTTERTRQRERSKERRDKDHNTREQRSRSRVSRDQRDSQRDKDRDDVVDRRGERSRDRDKDKESTKTLSSSSAIPSGEKTARYGRDKDRLKDCDTEKSSSRERRSDRDKDRSDSKNVDRDRNSQRFEGRYDRTVDKDLPIHKSVERDRSERFPRERSLERNIVDKSVSSSRDHLVDRDPLYDRDRHRRFGTRYERGHSDHDRKDSAHISSLKIDRLPDRRESPQRNIEIDRNFDRGYPRLPPEHWDEQDDPPAHVDYRDHHSHEDDRRKTVEARRYTSPFNERRSRDERTKSRYAAVPSDRPFDDLHHPIYANDKLRSGGIRDETTAENWDVHHDVEHGPRDRAYTGEWDEREWRARALWDRESLPRSDAHEEDWAARYDSPMSDWKLNESRKWDSQPLHLRGSYRNDRVKDLDAETSHGKRRSYNPPEVREEPTHCSKQSSLHASMKEEPINKKLMELAEGKPRRSREKSADSQKKKAPPKEKVEHKEPAAPEPKRTCLEEPLPTLHTESDLSDISDDPDDILNMDDEVTESNKARVNNTAETTERETVLTQNQESCQSPAKVPSEDTFFTREKETSETLSYSTKTIEDENMETMDFEEISDGELEEDIKTSCKGLGDALGVDWESLVKESQPRKPVSSNQARDRWHCKAVFQRIGISVQSVYPSVLESLVEKYKDNDTGKFLMDDLALMHTAIVRKNLTKNPSYGLLFNDDSLYAIKNENDTDDDDDDGHLKPCTSMYEEAKLLLKQAA